MKIKQNIIISLLVFLASYAFCAPRGRQELIKAGSWIYDAMTSISMESGHTNFSDQAPLSIAELQLYLKEVDYDSLSQAGKKQYDRIMEYCTQSSWSFDASIFSLGLEPYINLEGYYKTESSLDWVYNEYLRPGLIVVPVTFQAGDFFTFSTDLAARENKTTSRKSDNYTNIPIAVKELDINFPDTGYASAGFMFTDDAGMNFQLGIGNQSIGRSLTGSVIWSEYMTGASYANIEVFSPNIRYNMNVSEFNVDKYMYTHRMDVRLFKKFQFTAMEAMLVNAPLELRFLNPWTIYHGTTAWRDYGSGDSHNCAYMCFKLTYTPIKYLRIYGLFAQDQYQTLSERYYYPNDTTPNAISFQLGLESYVPIGKGYLHTWLEGTYTDPYMYIKQDKDWSLVRIYTECVSDSDDFYEWIGSPFGPDTIAGQLNIGYEVPGEWSLTLSYLLKAAGEYSGTKVFNYSTWVYPDSDNEGGAAWAKEQQSWLAPHGTVEFLHRLSLKAVWTPSSMNYLTIYSMPAFVAAFNHNNQSGVNTFGFEITLGASVDLLRMF